MNKMKSLIAAHKFFLFFFGFLLLYSIFVSGRCTPWSAGDLTLAMYALDYSFGFSDKLLPGAIYHLFFKDFKVRYVNLFSSILLILFFIVVAYFLEKLMLSAAKGDRVLYGTVIWFFLTGPATFSVFVISLGIIEVFWFYIAALFFLLMTRCQLAPFTVILCIAAILVNNASIFVVVPMFCILLLFRLSLEPDYSRKKIWLVAFVLSVGISIPFFFYFTAFGKGNMTYSYDEFVSLMETKGVDPKYPGYFFYPSELVSAYLPQYEDDANISLYLAAYNAYLESTGFSRLIYFLLMQFRGVHSIAGSMNFRDYTLELLLLSPLLGALTGYFCWRLCDKKEKKLKRFVFFCIPTLFVLEILFSFLFSRDAGKWISYSTLVLFINFIYILYYERSYAVKYIRTLLRKCPPPALAVYALIYSFSFFPFI